MVSRINCKQSREIYSLIACVVLIGLAGCGMGTPSTNQAPSFSKDSYKFTVAGNDTSIGSLVATDPDGNSLTYSILSASTSNASNTDIFAIDGTSGELSIASGKSLALSDSPYTLTVQSSDNGNPALRAHASVQVIVRSGLSFESQSFTVSENKGNLVGDTAIGTVQATTAQGRTLTYSLLRHNDVFTINPRTGVLSLAENQCLDYSTSSTYHLLVAVNDGTATETKEVSIRVQEAESNRNLCGDISSMAPVINGTASPFFYGGNGTQSNPYIIPISRCCADFTLTYDPNYSTAPQSTYFRANLIDGKYAVTVENTEAITTEEPSTWRFYARDKFGVPAGSTLTSPFSLIRSDPAGLSFDPVTLDLITRGAITITIDTRHSASSQLLSKKSFRFQRQ